MFLAFIAPLCIGFLGVLQNTWNKQISEKLGLLQAIIVNNIVLLAGGILLYFGAKLLPESSLPDLMRVKANSEWQWRFLLPGLAGLFIIIVAPLAISRVGAVRVFVGIVAAQLVTSLLWDWLAEDLPVTGWKFCAVAEAVQKTG
jgi:transporter family-2 protein